MTAGRMIAGLDGLRFQHWQVESRGDGVVIVTIDRGGQPVNALSQDMLIEFGELLERLQIDPPRAVVIRSGKPSGFVAGADIKEFQDFDAKGTVKDALFRGQQTLQRLAELPCPTVAAIHGYCMGGGTELALACRYRVASNDPSTRIGLPEVKLGIYPGWGGSVRLPRLVGAPAAMDLMLTGRTLVRHRPRRAIGLVDKVVDAPMLVDAAVELATKGTTAPVQATRAGMGDELVAGAPAACADAGQAGRAQGTEGALPGAVCLDRHLASRRRRHPVAARRPSASRWSSSPPPRPRAT